MDYIKIKNICFSKDSTKKIERQVIGGEKNIQIVYIFDIELVYRICKEFFKIRKNPIKNMQNSFIYVSPITAGSAKIYGWQIFQKVVFNTETV